MGSNGHDMSLDWIITTYEGEDPNLIDVIKRKCLGIFVPSDEYSWAISASYRTRHWHELKAGRHEVSGGLCEFCGKDRGTYLHHLYPERYFFESLDDVRLLCRDCHKGEHPDIVKQAEQVASRAVESVASVAGQPAPQSVASPADFFYSLTIEDLCHELQGKAVEEQHRIEDTGLWECWWEWQALPATKECYGWEHNGAPSGLPYEHLAAPIFEPFPPDNPEWQWSVLQQEPFGRIVLGVNTDRAVWSALRRADEILEAIKECFRSHGWPDESRPFSELYFVAVGQEPRTRWFDAQIWHRPQVSCVASAVIHHDVWDRAG